MGSVAAGSRLGGSRRAAATHPRPTRTETTETETETNSSAPGRPQTNAPRDHICHICYLGHRQAPTPLTLIKVSDFLCFSNRFRICSGFRLVFGVGEGPGGSRDPFFPFRNRFVILRNLFFIPRNRGFMAGDTWGIRRIKDQGPRTKDQGPRIKDQGPRTKDQGPRTMDQGSRSKDQGSRIMDLVLARMSILEEIRT